jgi:hypothetical protein
MQFAAYTLIIFGIVAILIFFLVLNHLYRPMSIGRYDQPEGNPWQEYWGESYGPKLKQHLLKPFFDKLEKEERIGNLIVDLGSGAWPVTRLLGTRPDRKRICVDIAADNVKSLDELRIRLDAEKVGQFRTLSFQKAILRICAFLELNPRTEAKTELVSTIVISDLLNYVDFRMVLTGFAKYLKTGGRVIILNLPYRGNRSLFSDKGLKDNHQLYAFLKEDHFEIEQIAFPKRARQVTDVSQELIVLVARKKAPQSVSGVNQEMDFFGEDTGDVADYIPAKEIDDHVSLGGAENKIRGSDGRGNIDNCIGRRIAHSITREHRMPFSPFFGV